MKSQHGITLRVFTRLTMLVGMALACVLANAPQTQATTTAARGNGGMAKISGAVYDAKGKPLANALVTMLREGAQRVAKQVRSGKDGSFVARLMPGRYVLTAIADGYAEFSFGTVDARPTAELVYRFNLEPAGRGRTVPEQRRDRDSSKWIIRASGGRRSVFQAQEADAAETGELIAAAEAKVTAEQNAGANDAQPDANDATLDDILTPGVQDTPVGETNDGRRVRGVVENYFVSSVNGGNYQGTSFAVSSSAGDNVTLLFAGQTGAGANAPQRLEAGARVRLSERHRLNLNLGGVRLNSFLGGLQTADGMRLMTPAPLGQISLRALDEWTLRDGVIVVLGVDYARFVGAGDARAVRPRIGIQFDPNARTRVRAAYSPMNTDETANITGDGEAVTLNTAPQTRAPLVVAGGRALPERSQRLEVGVERILNNASNLEATVFLDTTEGRGLGLLALPLTQFGDAAGEALTQIAEQRGAARGARIVYTRRVNRLLTASAGYAFGRGQTLASTDVTDPAELFANDYFQTASVQLGLAPRAGTNVRMIYRFSPRATVFAIDPFAGRLAVYDPSLSVLITQDLPTFGLPLRAEAIFDARNLLDVQTGIDDGETSLSLLSTRRSVRGGISVRF